MTPLRTLFVLLSAALAATSAGAMQPQAGRLPDETPTRIQGLFPAPIGRRPLVWKCVHATGAACSAADLASPALKQIVILPSGFAEADRGTFWSEFDKTVSLMTQQGTAGTTWSVQRASQLLFVGYFIPGGALGTPQAVFGGVVATHPIRGYALSLSQSAVYSQIDAIRQTDIAQLRPFGAAVMFNTFQSPVTANASPPSLVQRPFGVAKFTRNDIAGSAYVPTHELAHASLNFLDEYVENGFQDLSVKQIDVATPLALFDGSWGGFINAISDLFGVYDYNISEILANNGNDNMATVSGVTTVSTPNVAPQTYQYEGGMFFGRGTWHQAGNNLMNSNTVMRGPDDGFAYAHSPSQQQVVDNAFGGQIPRPNDRLRNAGPRNGWPAVLGSTTHVMLFDGDKNHHFHPTQQYEVQVGWYDRVWRTCYWHGIPYPCYDNVWQTANKWVYPEYRSLSLKMSSLYGLAKLAQQLVCAVGISEVKSNGSTIRLCDQNLDTIANNFLPTLSFPVPYQDVSVPASQWFTTYWWRFGTWNGAMGSGFTGWSSFYRSL
jgi:hypothetical protein